MFDMNENQLKQFGFKVLQEKENMLFYEKNNENDGFIFVIYDRKEQKIKSVDAYSFDQKGMKINSLVS